MKKIYDVVVVGSGPSGVHAAYPLVEAGLKVAMIDGGLKNGDDIFEKTNQFLKIKSNIKINQSLAKGGLSEVWPGICDFFNKKELTNLGLPPSEILDEYKEISNLINLELQPELNIQTQSILNADKQVYRLPITISYHCSEVIEKMKKSKNFKYIPNHLVYKFKEEEGFLELESKLINKSTVIKIKTKYLILAAGAINSTKILLRSLNLYNFKTPFLTKKLYAIVCLNTRILLMKKNTDNDKIGQVAMSNKDYFIQFYRGNPNALKKAILYIPLPENHASKLFSFIIPKIIIADVRFPTFPSREKFSFLTRNEILEISFHQTSKEINIQKNKLNKIKKKLFSLGFIPLKIITNDVTSHYSNGVPIQVKPGKLSSDKYGKLHQSKRVYLADSSIWRMLPAKPPTLTIMANARRVGKHVLKNFKINY